MPSQRSCDQNSICVMANNIEINNFDIKEEAIENRGIEELKNQVEDEFVPSNNCTKSQDDEESFEEGVKIEGIETVNQFINENGIHDREKLMIKYGLDHLTQKIKTEPRDLTVEQHIDVEKHPNHLINFATISKPSLKGEGHTLHASVGMIQQHSDGRTLKGKMSVFNKEKDEMLIELVKCNPVLYDASHSDYKSNVLKYMVWENISKSLEIPVADVKKRWKHLRDHYMKKKKADSGTGQAKSLNQWEYMPQLTFLSQAPSQRATLTNAEISEVAETEEIEEDTHDTHGDEENPLSQIAVQNSVSNDVDSDAISASSNASGVSVTPSIGRKRKKSNENSMAAILEKRQEERSLVFAKLLSQTTKSPTHKFFDSMADIVSEFPPHFIAEARHKVFEAVHEVEMKVFDEQSTSRAMVPNNSTGDSVTYCDL